MSKWVDRVERLYERAKHGERFAGTVVTIIYCVFAAVVTWIGRSFFKHW